MSADSLNSAHTRRSFANFLAKEKLTFYIGFDPRRKVSPSVTMLQCALWRICRNAGIIPSCFSAGTAMIADPSGKTELRKLLSVEELDNNVAGIKKQMERLVRFDGENGAVIVNNADWLETSTSWISCAISPCIFP